MFSLRSARYVLRAILVAVVLADCLALSGPKVSATTGDTYVLPRSPYTVPSRLFPLYRGRYSLTAIGKGARIAYAQGFITTNQYHDLYGGFVFYGYDAQGLKSSWINILYDFRQLHGDTMVITLFGWGSPPLGTLYVKRTSRGNLVGYIKMVNGKKYPISFRKDSNST